MGITQDGGAVCRIAVIGATGRLGRMLRWSWQGRADLAPRWIARRPGPGIATGDVVDPLAVAPERLAICLRDADVVLCLAGPVPQPGQADDPGTMAVHPQLAAALLAGAAGAGHLILLSSAAIYGDSPGLLSETTPPAPRSAYGHAKLAMEAVAGQWSGRPRPTLLRLGNVAGADLLLGGAAKRAADGDASPVALHVFADGSSPARSSIGPVTLARVLADIALALHRGAPVPGLLNLAAPGTVAMADLLDAAGLAWQPVPAPSGAIARVALDTAALQRLVGFAAAECTAAGIVAQWRALQAGQGG